MLFHPIATWMTPCNSRSLRLTGIRGSMQRCGVHYAAAAIALTEEMFKWDSKFQPRRARWNDRLPVANCSDRWQSSRVDGPARAGEKGTPCVPAGSVFRGVDAAQTCSRRPRIPEIQLSHDRLSL